MSKGLRGSLILRWAPDRELQRRVPAAHHAHAHPHVGCTVDQDLVRGRPVVRPNTPILSEQCRAASIWIDCEQRGCRGRAISPRIDLEAFATLSEAEAFHPISSPNKSARARFCVVGERELYCCASHRFIVGIPGRIIRLRRNGASSKSCNERVFPPRAERCRDRRSLTLAYVELIYDSCLPPTVGVALPG